MRVIRVLLPWTLAVLIGPAGLQAQSKAAAPALAPAAVVTTPVAAPAAGGAPAAAAVPASTAPAAPSDPVLQQLLNNVDFWRARGDDDKVAEMWRKVLRSYPGYPQALVELSQHESRKGNKDKSKQYIEELRRVQPDHPELARLERSTEMGEKYNVLLSQARALLKAKKTREAIEAYRKAFGNQPPVGSLALEFYTTLGGETEGWDEARVGLERVSRERPDDEELALAYARHLTYRQQTRYDGIRRLEAMHKASRLPDVKKRIREAWRLALDWSRKNPANGGLVRAYLAEGDDPEVRTWLGELNAIQARTNAYVAGDRAFEAGEVEKAEAIYKTQREKYKNDPLALVGLAKVAMKRGHLKTSKELLEQARVLAKWYPPLWKPLLDEVDFWLMMREADVQRAAGNLQEAENLAHQAAERSPANVAHVDLMLANIYAAQGKRAAARDRFDAVLQKDPASAAALFGNVQLLADEGQVADADVFNDRLQKLPATPSMTEVEQRTLRVTKARAQALVYAGAGRDERAREVLVKALERDPGEKWLLHDLVNRHLAVRDVREARLYLDELLAQEPNAPKAQLAEARVLAEEGRLAEAYKVVSSIPSDGSDLDLEAMRRDLLTRSTIARVVQQAGVGNGEQARRTLMTLEGDVAEHPSLLAGVAVAWCELGETERCHTLIKKVMARVKEPSASLRLQYGAVLLMVGHHAELAALLNDTPWQERLTLSEQAALRSLRVSLVMERVERCRSRGDLSGAFGHLRPLLHDYPDEPRVLVALGNLFLDKGSAREAYAVFERRLKADPKDLEAREGAIRAAGKLGYEHDARALIDEGLEAFPRSARMELIAARYDLSEGDDEAALDRLRKALVIDEEERDVRVKHEGDDDALPAEDDPGSLRPESDYDEILAVAADRFGQTPEEQEAQLPKKRWSVRREILAEINRVEARYGADISGGPIFRYRHGESGLGRLFQFRLPLVAGLPIGFLGRIRLLVAPDVIYAGSLDLDNAPLAGRFGRLGTLTLASGNGTIRQSEQGVALELGYEVKGFALHGGTTPLGYPLQTWVAGLGWGGTFGDLSVAADVSRKLLGDSLLAHAGAVDPVTGEEWGLVTANGARVDAAYSLDPLLFYLYGGYAWLMGTGVQDNQRVEGGGGFRWRVSRTKSPAVSTGLSLLFFHYERNLRYYTVGQGGYFSPQMFVNLAVPIELSGQADRLVYRVGGDVGLNWFHEDASPFYPLDAAAMATRGARVDALGDPVSNHYVEQSSLGVGLNAQAMVAWQFTSQLLGGFQAQAHFAGDYQEVVGGLFVGYGFRQGGAPAAPCVPGYWQ